MNLAPGTRPIHGDAVDLGIGVHTVTITGPASTRSILIDGRGYAELVLPALTPEQRTALEKTEHYAYELYRDGVLLYSSPELTLRETRQSDDGLVITGAP